LTASPPRALGLSLGLALLVAFLTASAFGLRQILLGAQPWLLGLWVVLPVVGLPLAAVTAYRLYGLLSARYLMDRDQFALRWGLAREVWPLEAIVSMQALPRAAIRAPWWKALCWPGCMVGECYVEGLGAAEIFAAGPVQEYVFVQSPYGSLVISPPDPTAFVARYHELLKLGSLEPVPHERQRPNFLSIQIWQDRMARALLLIGAGLCLGFLAFVAARLPGLPALIPFGYHPSGIPQARVPSSQLLLLPMMSGATWLTDLVVGSWLYRRPPQRSLAYLVWGMGAAVPSLLWGASLGLLALSS